jgi:hypothetical protein
MSAEDYEASCEVADPGGVEQLVTHIKVMWTKGVASSGLANKKSDEEGYKAVDRP